ncbi:PREDICTED: protein ripply2 [Crocodylus porosus]|uniref:protein ripply2 n=1 Tax=Crocodylus porosus TaxID=8502 RepID=UPI00093918E1|nr:PREDICTED: protein ripply2 [Crocodylus porosus]
MRGTTGGFLTEAFSKKLKNIDDNCIVQENSLEIQAMKTVCTSDGKRIRSQQGGAGEERGYLPPLGSCAPLPSPAFKPIEGTTAGAWRRFSPRCPPFLFQQFALRKRSEPSPGAALFNSPCPWPCRSGDYWRPWIPTRRESERGLRRNPSGPYSPYGMTEASRKLTQYTHPVRLFWPKSRCYDYLYQEAKALLKNFPVQATISFYEDSDSEDDDELDQDSGIECDD